MQSSFNQTRARRRTSSPQLDETYNLLGLNLVAPDEQMPKGESPFTINSRMYARNDEDSRVTNRSRKGASMLSDAPLGESGSTNNVAASTGDIAITTTRKTFQKVTSDATGRLTKLEAHLKKATGATGHVIVQVYTNQGGFPGSLVAQSVFEAGDFTTSYQYLAARLIEAPGVTNGTAYWLAYQIQDNGSGTYYVNKTATVGTAALYSDDEGVTYTSHGAETRYKTYVSTAKGIQGWFTYYPSSPSNNRIIFAQNGHVYAQVKATGVASSIATVAADVPIRFDQVDDKLIIIDGVNPAQWWDGTTTSNVPNVPSASPKDVVIWQNRAFFQTGPTRWDFSGLYDFDSYRSVDFFYVNNPKSADECTARLPFHDNLVILTHETKYQIAGTNLSNFDQKEAVGTKGCVGKFAAVADRNYIYFMADDKMIYKWAGGDDIPISLKMEPEFQGISDPSKVRLHLYRNQLRVYYTKTSGFNDRMALYDIPYDQWFMDTDHPVEGSAELTLDNNELVEFSSLVGAVYYGETQDSDLGRKIDWKYWTNYKIYGSAAAKKRIKRFRPMLRTADADYTMLVGKDMDFANNPDMREYIVASSGARWGAFVWGDGTQYGHTRHVQDRSPMSGRGHHIQYRFERSGVDTPVELYGYSSQYKVGKLK